jgi:hypothetical protein
MQPWGQTRGALVALDAVVFDPHGYVRGDAPLFVGGGPKGHGTVFHADEGADRQAVPFLGVDGNLDVFDKLRQLLVVLAVFLFGVLGVAQLGGHGDFLAAVMSAVNGRQIHLDDGLALFGVGGLRRFLHVFHRLLDGDDFGQVEEGGLEDHVGPVAKTQFVGNPVGVDDIELDVIFGDVLFHSSWAGFAPALLRSSRSSKGRCLPFPVQENAVLAEKVLVVAGDEAGGFHQVGGADRRGAKPQVGLGDAKGLLGVVFKICLGVHVVDSLIILMEFLLAPTVPSEPSPQNLQLMVLGSPA